MAGAVCRSSVWENATEELFMASSLVSKAHTDSRQRATARCLTEPWPIRLLLILITVLFLGLFLVLPLVEVFTQALAKGWKTYWAALCQPDTLSAVRLTLLTTAICVPVGTLFGLTAAWCLGKFDFPGRKGLLAVLDLPLSVSPVVAGLMFVLVFGRHGWLGGWLETHGIKIIFDVPGVVLVTLFGTVPYVARELIPLMEAQGTEGEEAALVLGASGWQTFWRVSLPQIKWGLLYGIVLCNARAMGEFGAVSVVSGHIRGKTNTMPLQVEILYNEYDFVGAFAVASLLAGLALITLVVKSILEYQSARQLALSQIAGPQTAETDLLEPPLPDRIGLEQRPSRKGRFLMGG